MRKIKYKEENSFKLDFHPLSCKWLTVWCTVIDPHKITSYYKPQLEDAFMAKVDGQGIIRHLITEEEIPHNCIRIFDIVGGRKMVRVLVILNGKKIPKDFENESMGKAFFKLAKSRFGKDNTFLISLTQPIPPSDEKHYPNKNKYWCPYCGDERRFKNDSWIGVNRCSICGITDRDFYIRKYNHLWTKTRKNFRRASNPVKIGGIDNGIELTKAEKRRLRRQKRKEKKEGEN